MDGHASDFGSERIEKLPVPSTLTTYYALFVPYVKGSLTIQHNERADTAGHCADEAGLKLDIEYSPGTKAASQTWTATGNKDEPASCVLDNNIIDEKNAEGRLKVTVSAKPHDGSLYKATYRNQTVVGNVSEVDDGYTQAVFEAPVSERFADSETVKGLKVLNTVSYSSVFSRGYTITYKFTARTGEKQEYVLTGNADTFEDFRVFVTENTPYQRTLTGDTVWDIDNMKLNETDYGMSAVLEEIPNIRGKCTVTIVNESGYQPKEQVEYGKTFTEEQAAKYLAPETNNDGKVFDHWKITRTTKDDSEGKFVANCYSRKFTFAVWNDYTIAPVYVDSPTGGLASESPSVTIDYIETSRNQWGGADKTDDTLNKTSVTDKIAADVDISFVDGNRKIIDAVDENGNNKYKLGVIFEICGNTKDGNFDDKTLQASENKTNMEAVVRQAVGKSSDNSTGSCNGVNYYYSRININENTVSSFNRSEFTRSFTNGNIKYRVLRMYAYMITPENKVVLSDCEYITFFKYANPDHVID